MLCLNNLLSVWAALRPIPNTVFAFGDWEAVDERPFFLAASGGETRGDSDALMPAGQ